MAGSAEAVCNLALGYAGVNKVITDIGSDSPSAQACNTYYTEYLVQLLSEFHWPWATRRVRLNPYAGPQWDPAVAYAKGAPVQYGANVYKALLANQNYNPDQSLAQWFQFTRDGWAFTCPLPSDFVTGIEIWERPLISPLAVSHIYPFNGDSRGNTLRSPLSVQRVPFDLEDANDGSGNQVLVTDLDQPILKYIALVTNPNSFSAKFTEALAWKLAVALNSTLRSDETKAELCTKMARSSLDAAVSDANRNRQEDPEPMSEFEAARKGIL